MIIPIKLIVGIFKGWFRRLHCLHHKPWKNCCRLDPQGVRWRCCKCDKTRGFV